jgi:NAD(P)H dehydrogenase (quinone)
MTATTQRKVLIVYDSKGELAPLDLMADQIAEGLREEGVDAEIRSSDQVELPEIAAADGLVLGSPSHFGSVSGAMKLLMERTYELHGRLDGKVGAAFTLSRHMGGGNETTLLDFHKFFMIHGMVIQGDPHGAHYGPFAIQPSPDVEPVCDESEGTRRLGRRVGRLVAAITGLAGKS